MQLLSSKIFILYIYMSTFLDSLLKGPQDFSTLIQIIFLEIGLKYIISDYNQGHIIWELHTQGSTLEFVQKLQFVLRLYPLASSRISGELGFHLYLRVCVVYKQVIGVCFVSFSFFSLQFFAKELFLALVVNLCHMFASLCSI